MQITTGTALLAVPLLSLALPGERMGFHPEAGKTLSKTFESEFNVELEDLSIIADGEDFTPMLGDLSFEMVMNSTIEVSDEYVAVDEGRPTKLRRTFEVLEGFQEVEVDAGFESDSQEIPHGSKLTGETVMFTWDEDSEEYEVEFVGDEGDRDLLDGLEEDMDLRGLLPDGEKKEGDRWEIPIESLMNLYQPGGNLHILPEDMDVEGMEEMMDMFMEMGEDFEEELMDMIEGRAIATFAGTREIDGTEMGIVNLEVEVSLLADLTDMIYEVLNTVLEQQGIPIEIDFNLDVAEIDMSYSGEAQMLWNLAGGHAHSMESEGNYDLSFELVVEVEAEGESHSLEAFAEVSGELTQSISAN